DAHPESGREVGGRPERDRSGNPGVAPHKKKNVSVHHVPRAGDSSASACYCAAAVGCEANRVARRAHSEKMSSQRRPQSGGGASGGLAPPPRPRPRLLTTGGLKGWQYGVLVVSCVGSMLAGASVVHRLFPPDLVRERDR
ncbi:unnamed protein product, partial [Ectocarpus sp. 4 AP-2014]